MNLSTPALLVCIAAALLACCVLGWLIARDPCFRDPDDPDDE